jgi:hypothetical protein
MSGRTHLGMPAFPEAAKASTKDQRLRANLRHATHTIRDKRARAVGELDDWAQLREAGKRIKDHTLRHLDTYLLQLEDQEAHLDRPCLADPLIRLLPANRVARLRPIVTSGTILRWHRDLLRRRWARRPRRSRSSDWERAIAGPPFGNA